MELVDGVDRVLGGFGPRGAAAGGLWWFVVPEPGKVSGWWSLAYGLRLGYRAEVKGIAWPEKRLRGNNGGCAIRNMRADGNNCCVA